MTGLCVIKAKGGMGNRMLCAASGILWARAAGRSPYVDWRDEAYSHARENSFHHFFDNPRVLREAPVENGDIHPPVWRGRLDKSVSEMIHALDPDQHSSPTIHRTYSLDPRRADYPQPLVVFWHYMGRFRATAPLARARVPGYASLSLEAITRKALREELTLRPDVRARVDDFACARFDRPMVGVHVRYTDRTTDLDAIERGAKRLLAGLDSPGLFLTTDNARVEARFRERFDRVVTTPKWFPPEGATMHQNASCADPVENGIEALVDMHLLSRCDALVYASRSTFSEISRLLGAIPRERVIDVDRFNPAMIAKRMIRRVTE